MIRVLRRFVMAGLVAAGLVAPLTASTAQEAGADPRDTVVAELTIVAPGTGPAWWKVSKGDASVWILGLPTNTPQRMRWDQSTLKRRLKGARLMLGVYNEVSRFGPGVEPPLASAELETEVAQLSRRLGRRIYGPADAVDLMNLRNLYYRRHRLCFCAYRDLEATVRAAGVPMVTPPPYSHIWQAKAFAADHPQSSRCVQAVLGEATTPPKRLEDAAKLWAKGDVPGYLAAMPKGIEHDCGYLWPGVWERTIDFQTSLIAQALDRPGKIVAAAMIGHLVARDGILERLRAQGFTIHDPSKPLEE